MIQRCSRRAGAVLCLLCGLLTSIPDLARAEENLLARADALFLEGKGRYSRGDLDGACRDFAESVRLDPATGALLALAMCHERESKFATATREYDEVLVRSESEGRADRVRAARARIAAIAPKLSTITVALSQSEGPTGLTLRVAGRALTAEEIGKPVPVDGGTVAVEATAHGMNPFSANLTVGPSQDHPTLTIPELTPIQIALPAIRPAVFFASAPAAALRHEPKAPWLNDVRWLGIGTATVGALGLSAGAALAVRAHDVEQREARCDQGVCQDEGPRSPFIAKDARRAATLSFVGAGAVLATGLTLMLWGGRVENERSSSRKVALSPWVTPREGGATLRASF